MTLESVTSTLEERGIVWQGVRFAAIGAISVPLLSIYSEADHWSIGVYSLAMTQFNWAFALAIGLVIEGVRRMFETRTEIRRAARTKAIENALKKERAEAEQAKKRNAPKQQPASAGHSKTAELKTLIKLWKRFMELTTGAIRVE